MSAVQGRVGHGNAMNVGAPVAIGGKASSSLPTAVDAADAVNAYFDLNGRQVVVANNAPSTSGGLSMSKTVSAASTNATVVKASAGQVYSIQVNNVNAAVRYLKLYNKATAPTVGTDTPVKTLAIPAGTMQSFEFSGGLAFATGIGFALTTEATDAGATAVAANEHVVNIDYF